MDLRNLLRLNDGGLIAVDLRHRPLGAEAKDTFGPDVTAIQTQLTALSGAVDEVQGGTSVASVAPAVVSSLTELKTALSNLESTAQSQDCDLS